MPSSVTLMLGDCLERMKDIPNGSIDLIVSDPPYGVKYHHGGGPVGRRTRSASNVAWGSISGDDAIDQRWLEEMFRVLKTGGAAYICTRWDVEPEWRNVAKAAGFTVKQRLTWHKRVTGKGDLRGTYGQSCEDVLFLTKGRHFLNGRPPMLLDVGCVPTWEIRYHPHQKPVALPSALIETSSFLGAIVLDPFMGSGTFGVACVNTGRSFIGIERDEGYFAIAQRRIADAQNDLLRVAS